MPWTQVTGLTSPNTIPDSVRQNLIAIEALQTFIDSITDGGAESIDRAQVLRLRAQAAHLETAVRAIRNDLGII